MRRARAIPLAACLALALAAAARADDALWNELAAARRAFDDAGMAAAQQELLARAAQQPDSFPAEITAAESYVVRADPLRNARKIRDLPADQDERAHEQQVEWGRAGLPYAERALALARTDPERAHAERVLGELYAHQIKGMFGGMTYGPKARNHLTRALELSPDDVESQRAIGLMYLNNPSITGGDVPKAIETFTICEQKEPDSDQCAVLLAMAYRKQDEPAKAREAAQEALRRNPSNQDARALLELVH